MTPEEKLNLFFAAQRPPARDLAFETTVAQRVALRRAVATVLALVPWAVAAIAVLWAAQPVVGRLAASLSDVATSLAMPLALSFATVLGALLLTRLQPGRFRRG